jgi:mannitol/fructose-specific phosphotransferase system IIA component
VAHRERHVVAGIAVGDREHVQVVDLLAPLLQMRERDPDDVTETDDR